MGDDEFVGWVRGEVFLDRAEWDGFGMMQSLVEISSPPLFPFMADSVEESCFGEDNNSKVGGAVLDYQPLMTITSSMEDVVNFSVGSGEGEKFSNCASLMITAPNWLDTLTELEVATEVLSLKAKLDISGWVKHRIPGFSGFVGLSIS